MLPPMPRRRGRAALGAAAAALVFVAADAQAYDAEVDASVTGQAYQLRGLTGDPVLSRRRVTSTLQLGVYDLGGDGKKEGPQLTFRTRMRLDTDFGYAREEYALGKDLVTSRFVPLLQPAPVEMMYGYLEGRRYLGGYLGFKLGRQYLSDPLGWYGFDGGLVRVTTPFYVAFEAYGGFESRAALPFTTRTQIGRFEAPGMVRMDRSELPLSGYPSVQPAGLAPTYGLALESAGPTWIHGRFTYRKAWNTGTSYVGGNGALLGPDAMGIYDARRVSSERLGWGVNVTPLDLLGVRGNLVYDLYGQRFSDVEAGLDLYLGKHVDVSVDYTYFRPIFDADSIFSVFGFEPMDDVSARVDVRPTDRFSFGVDGRVRRFHSDDPTSLSGGPVRSVSSLAPGFGGNARYRLPTAIIRGKTYGLFGDQGRRVGGDLLYTQQLGRRLSVDAQLSLWNFLDRLRVDGAGNPREATSVGYLLAAGYQLTPDANAMLQWEHDQNRLVGNRFRVMAVLHLKVWL